MIDPIALTRSLVDIDSTTGREGEVAAWLADFLRDRGYHVSEQPIRADRFNVYAQPSPAGSGAAGSRGTSPQIVFSTHFDCVPPFFPSRVERDLVFGRGACDAKGILAAQVAAAESLRAAGETRFALLFLAGEERGSDGARVANERAPAGVRYLINGEPTDNRLGAATRGALRVRLHAAGRAAHSSFPELGDSAIDKLLDALMVIRGIALPDDPLMGRTHYTVGLIEGGVAPNVVSPRASAELMFRTVGDGARVRELLNVVSTLVTIEQVLDVPPIRMHTLPGFETAVFPYTTDVPFLTRWGRPLLVGPGSIHVAHTDEEHLSIDELHHAVDLYRSVAMALLAEQDAGSRVPTVN
jgi:acetylornithine deacetylase